MMIYAKCLVSSVTKMTALVKFCALKFTSNVDIHRETLKYTETVLPG